MKRVYALYDGADVPLAVTALCGTCIHDTGQKLAAIESAHIAQPDEKPDLTFRDTAGQWDLPCYICGHEFCQEFDDNGSCVHSECMAKAGM